VSEETTVQLGGLVMGTRDPGRASEWYLAAFGPAAQPAPLLLGRPVVTIGGSRLVFDQRDDVAEVSAEPQRVLINLFVDDIQVLENSLNSLHATWVRPVEQIPGFGYIATVNDLDGNYVQLLERSA
jgi:predicted enzyme related to lactoylglutathione lyase